MNFKEPPFESFWDEPCMKYFIDIVQKSLLAFCALFLITRINHFIPDFMKDEYELIAEMMIDRNADELNFTSNDIVLDSRRSGPEEDWLMELIDFIVQICIAVIFVCKVLTDYEMVDTLKAG
jgi:hypothetical protein